MIPVVNRTKKKFSWEENIHIPLNVFFRIEYIEGISKVCLQYTKTSKL